MAPPCIHKKRTIHADWSNLHKDLLELIFKRLRRAGDLIRFGAVCKPWRSVAVESRQGIIKPVSPLLLLPPDNNNNGLQETFEDNEVYELFDFSKNKASKILLPEARGTWCCNSSNGWLVTMKHTPHEIHLLNPLTRVQIQLPPATTFQDPPLESFDAQIETTIHKAIASSNPLDPNCIIMAIYGHRKKLAFCRPGDTRWQNLKSEISCCRDIIYYKDKFYALGFSKKLVLCDFGLEPKVIVAAQPQPITRRRNDHNYLVESSSGDLLMVLRRLRWEITPDNEWRYKTVMFELFKLDFSKREWEDIKSLGDNSIFVGFNVSMFISTEDFPEFRGDCIYFTDDCYCENIYGWHDMGVFSLKTQQTEPMFDFSRIYWSPLFWVAPDLSSTSSVAFEHEK